MICFLKILIILACIIESIIASEKESGTPFNERLHNDTLLWGVYRQTLIHGMRMKRPTNAGLLTGFAWYFVDDYTGWRDIRVASVFSEGMKSIGYVEHDGRIYSKQVVRDSCTSKGFDSVQEEIPLDLQIETIKFVSSHDDSDDSGIPGGHWSIRVKGKTRAKVAVIYFVTHDTSDGNPENIQLAFDHNNHNIIKGKDEFYDRKEYRFELAENTALNKNPVLTHEWERKHLKNVSLHDRRVSVNAPHDFAWKHKDLLTFMVRQHGLETLKRIASEKHPSASHVMILPDDPELQMGKANFHAFQRLYQGDFEFDMAFSVDHQKPVMGKPLTEAFSVYSQKFISRFDTIFPVAQKTHQSMARYALSNMLGGIGYFYGSSMERIGNRTRETASYGLFSDTPCKTMFPRGFLWDSGFHHLIISRWDAHLSLEILENWYDTMSEDGWIAREQILGEESRSRVPPEFVAQVREYANPPTLLLPIWSMLMKVQDGTFLMVDDDGIRSDPKFARQRIKRLYPKLKRHFQWYLKTQTGSISNELKRRLPKVDEKYVFRWRGRAGDHTLTSGLDDYPRSPVASKYELHLDLASWMAFAARLLWHISKYLSCGTFCDDDMLLYRDIESKILVNIETLHWDSGKQRYTDTLANGSSLAYLGNHGYISLFPLMLGHVSPLQSERLEAILDFLMDPREVYSDFGILSLARSHPLFGGGENYWKGPIWINLNYLIVSALQGYSKKVDSSSLKKRLQSFSKRLQDNIVNNLHREYVKTEALWEQYNPDSGNGQRSKPFTGWSSLVLLMLAGDGSNSQIDDFIMDSELWALHDERSKVEL